MAFMGSSSLLSLSPAVWSLGARRGIAGVESPKEDQPTPILANLVAWMWIKRLEPLSILPLAHIPPKSGFWKWNFVSECVNSFGTLERAGLAAIAIDRQRCVVQRVFRFRRRFASAGR
jgi:hypothetical protein